MIVYQLTMPSFHVYLQPVTRFSKTIGSCLNVCVLFPVRSEEHTSELQSLTNLVCRLLLAKKIASREVKGRVAHYTPHALAALLAMNLLTELAEREGAISVLDSASRDGSLISALFGASPRR